MAPKKPAADKPQAKSKRGAKPLPSAAVTGDLVDGDKLAARHGALVAMSAQQQALVDQFGDGLPWHPDHYEAAIRGALRRGCEAFLYAGRHLIVARECALHGEWQGIIDRLGIGRDQASRMMEAARRVLALPNVAHAQHLIEAAGTQGKLIALLSLPEDQFAELAEQGTTGGLDVDGIEQMTRDELRAAVREARADMDAKDQRINKLSEGVNKAEEKASKAAHKWQGATPDEQLVTLLAEMDAASNRVRFAIATGSEEAGLSGAVIAVMEHANTNELNVDEQVAGLLANLINDLRLLRDHDAVGLPPIQDRHYADWQRDAGK